MMYAEWADTLSQVKLFENIDLDELSRVLGCLRPRVAAYRKGELLTMADDEYTGVGIVLEGTAIVTRDNAAGDRLVLAKLMVGSMFGEILAFSDSGKWPATIVASTDCRVLYMPPDKIVGNCPKMCAGHGVMIRNMLKIVSRKALELNRNINYISMKKVRTKISAYLLEQHRLAGAAKFVIPFKRNELAEYLNVTRPSLSRELVRMKDEGLIDFSRSAFEIKDKRALQSNL